MMWTSTTRKLEKAEQLITGFGRKREKLASMLDPLQNKYWQLVGEILLVLAAGMVAYLWVFPWEERQWQDWMAWAAELDIPFTPDFFLASVLGNPILTQTEYANGLLRDNFSMENSIMLWKTRRWVLMVDPQDIANRRSKPRKRTRT
jgi:dynein heavy chain, axonemal